MALSDVDHAAGGDRQGEAGGKSLAQLAADLSRELTELVHHEIELAKVEVSEKAKRAGLGVGIFGVAGMLAVFGLGCLTVAAVAAVHLAVPVWLAALVVAAGYLLVAGVLSVAGRREVKRATPPVPTQAIESAKEDVEWLKQQTRSARQ